MKTCARVIVLLGLLIFGQHVFAQEKVPVPKEPDPALTIALTDVKKHIGEQVKVCGKIFGSNEVYGKTTVYLGKAFPNQLLTVILNGDPTFKALRDKAYNYMCVTGKVMMYKGKPQIVVIYRSNVELTVVVGDTKGKRPGGG